MIEYAANDVKYLPQLYEIFIEKFKEKEKMIDDVFKECQKYLIYPKLNLNVKNFNRNTLKNQTITGLFK